MRRIKVSLAAIHRAAKGKAPFTGVPHPPGIRPFVFESARTPVKLLIEIRACHARTRIIAGAAGGAAAKVLTEGGVSVVMLEAGPSLNPAKDFKEHLWPYDLAHRGAGMGGKLRGEEADSASRLTARATTGR
jgi:hypothetical protein